MNVAQLAVDELDRNGVYEKIRFEGRSYTNAELFEMAGRLSGSLRDLGVERGDRVVVMLPNCPEVFACFGGILRLGATVVPVLFLLTELELAHVMAHSGARMAITSPEFLPKLQAACAGLDPAPTLVCLGGSPPPGVEELGALIERGTTVDLVDVDDHEVAVLSYTSGTTGIPKGVMLSHGNALFNARASAAAADVRDGDRNVLTLPLAHSFGIGVMLTGQLFKITAVLLRWFTAEGFFDAVMTHRVTNGSVVPTMLSFLLADPGFEAVDWSSLRWLVSGGAPLPVELAAEFERRTGVKILQGYGLTETSPTISLMRYDDPPRPGSCGRPVDGCEVRIVDEEGSPLPPGETGEIVCRGPNVMLGYRDMPAETAAAIGPDGWFATGDVGHLDADGYLYVTDRKKDLIIRGGFNIIPRDIEEVLHTHPQVAQAAVVGGKHPSLGEEVVAFVVPVPGTQPDEASLIAHCQAALAKYKTPSRVVLRDALPMNGIGKILRRELRDEASKIIAEG